jgi:hypothetical protein
MLKTPFNASRQATSAQTAASNLSTAEVVYTGDFAEFCTNQKVEPTFRKQQKKDGSWSDNLMCDFIYNGKICRAFLPAEQAQADALWLTINRNGDSLNGNLSPYEKSEVVVKAIAKKAEAPAK